MRLSQIASSYSFLYRKSGTNTGDGLLSTSENRDDNNKNEKTDINTNNFISNNNIRSTPQISEPKLEQGPYYLNHDGNFYDKHYRSYQNTLI